MTNFYNRKGELIEGGVLKWAALYEDSEYRRVKFSAVKDMMLVSTIWQGFSILADTNSFETVIMKAGDIIRVERVTTEEDAVALHDSWVAELGGEVES